MNDTEFWLAVLPPALAIAIEALTPFTGAFFSRHAASIASDEVGALPTGPGALEVGQAVAMIETLLKTAMAGAASIAGLAPTLVAFVMTGLTVFVSVERPFPWLIGLTVVAMITVLAVVRLVAGNTLFQLESVPIRMFGRPMIRPTRLFIWLVFATNGVLIAGFVCVHQGWLS